MKKATVFLFIMIAFACKKEITSTPEKAKTPIELGKEIFEGKGNCIACHQPNQKIVGPSIQDIAQAYKDKNSSIVTFLKGNGEPIVDPSQYEVMKTNFAITKTMTDEELNAIKAYIDSHLQ